MDVSDPDFPIRSRPAFTGCPQAVEVAVRQESTIADVPACRVTYSGPVSGRYDHPGGDLKIGFTVAGVYTIAFDPFPALPVSLALTVTP